MSSWIWIPVIAGVILATAFSMYKGLKERERSLKLTFTSFFLSKERISDSEIVSTLAATNTALALIVFWFSYLSWLYGLEVGIWLALFWIMGLELFAILQKRWSDYPGIYTNEYESSVIDKDEPKFHTLHEYISDKRSISARRSLALISIITFLLMMTVELTRGMRVFETVGLTNSSANLDLIALFIILGASIYAAVGGFRAVIITDKWQIFLTFIALIISLIISVYGIWNHDNLFGLVYSPNNFSLKSLLLFINQPFLIIGSIFSWSFWFIVTMDMWQRASAARKISMITNKTRKILYPWFILITLTSVSIGAYVRTNLPNDYNQLFPAVTFIEILINKFNAIPIIGAFLITLIFVGFITAMLSTLDTYFLAVGQSVLRDLPNNSVVENYRKKYFPKLLAMIATFAIALSIYPIYLLITHSNFSINTLLYLATSSPFILLCPILFKKYNNNRSIILSCTFGFVGLFIFITYMLGKLVQAKPTEIAYWYNWLYITPIIAAVFSFFGFATGKFIGKKSGGI